MGKYRFLLWDVDETLLDFEKSQDYALTFSFNQFHKECPTEVLKRYNVINQSFWKRYETGEITKQDVLYGRFEKLFDEMRVKDIPLNYFEEIYQKALGDVYFFKDDSYTLLKELQKDYRQFLVTNGVISTQLSKLKLSGLDKLVENIFISEKIGMPKPQKEYFDRCFDAIPDFIKKDAIIIGDSLSSDMLGGNNAGISTCWYNPFKKRNETDVKINFEIKNLWEIKEIL